MRTAYELGALCRLIAGRMPFLQSVQAFNGADFDAKIVHISAQAVVFPFKPATLFIRKCL